MVSLKQIDAGKLQEIHLLRGVVDKVIWLRKWDKNINSKRKCAAKKGIPAFKKTSEATCASAGLADISFGVSLRLTIFDPL